MRVPSVVTLSDPYPERVAFCFQEESCWVIAGFEAQLNKSSWRRRFIEYDAEVVHGRLTRIESVRVTISDFTFHDSPRF